MNVPKPNLAFFDAHPPTDEDDTDKPRRKRKIQPSTTQVENARANRPPMRMDQTANATRAERASVSIEWREPPAIRRSRPESREIDQIVSMLKANPGRWARVFSGASAVSRWQSFRRRGCEARMSTVDDGLYECYARWPEGTK